MTTLATPERPIGRTFIEVTPRAVERWLAKVDKSDGPTACWWWTAARMGRGYGNLGVGGFTVSAHRFAFVMENGRQPDPYQVVHHTCGNGALGCVNPLHLVEVTNRENVLMGRAPSAQNAAKTHCHRGHPFTEANTYRGSGGRHCRLCVRIRRATFFPASNATKTHCKHGHEFTPENTYRADGRRSCRECGRLKVARRRAKRRAEAESLPVAVEHPDPHRHGA